MAIGRRKRDGGKYNRFKTKRPIDAKNGKKSNRLNKNLPRRKKKILNEYED